MEDGVPSKLMKELVGKRVKVELNLNPKKKCRTIVKGTLTRYEEDHMNCELEDVKISDSKGTKRKLDSIFIRGTEVIMIILPKEVKSLINFKPSIKSRLGSRVESRERSLSLPSTSYSPKSSSSRSYDRDHHRSRDYSRDSRDYSKRSSGSYRKTHY